MVINASTGVLVVLFSIEYPPDCYTAFCRERFTTQVEVRLSQPTDFIHFLLTSTDGYSLEADMNLCSFNQTESGMCMLLNHTKRARSIKRLVEIVCPVQMKRAPILNHLHTMY